MRVILSHTFSTAPPTVRPDTDGKKAEACALVDIIWSLLHQCQCFIQPANSAWFASTGVEVPVKIRPRPRNPARRTASSGTATVTVMANR